MALLVTIAMLFFVVVLGVAVCWKRYETFVISLSVKFPVYADKTYYSGMFVSNQNNKAD